jgi:hypothetical protein
VSALTVQGYHTHHNRGGRIYLTELAQREKRGGEEGEEKKGRRRRRRRRGGEGEEKKRKPISQA